MSFQAVDEVRVDPDAARFYAEGWQSWSPTTWAPWGTPPHPQVQWEHTMRFRPGSPLPTDGLQAEGLLVVDPGTGDPTRTYSVKQATDEVATIRASLSGDRLSVSADGPVATDTHHAGPTAALTAFGDSFAARAGVGDLTTPPRVWCSWYRYFEDVTARDIEENVAALDGRDLPVDVVQIDDGWSRGMGEWVEPADGFPDLPRLVDHVRATGRRVGIWLAPFMVGVETDLARRRPEWLTGDAGYNWRQDMRGLDLTNEGVREHVFSTVRRLRDLGVDYFKLDFLYAGALPSSRPGPISPVAAYRSGLELIREAAGDDSYLLGCGAPILPSVGLVDAMRVSPDTFHEGGQTGSTGLRGRMSLVARAWQQGRFWVNDPDCLVTRPTYTQREPWAATFATFGGLRSFSDRICELDDWGLVTTRRLMGTPAPPRPFDDDVVTLGRLDGRESLT